MDQDPQEESKKDKRMLVLLAFGLLLLLSGIAPQHPEQRQTRLQWGWVEQNDGGGYTLQRLRLGVSGQDRARGLAGKDLGGLLQQHQAVAVQGRGETATVASGISPRLAFLLGLPFPINRATVEELILLDGVGPKLAEGIVSARARQGPIADQDGLRAVPGIGEKLAARLAPQLSFE